MTKSIEHQIRLGYSPCPNDTYLFYALAHGKVDTSPYSVSVEHHIISDLNRMAGACELDITKLSIVALGGLLDRYALLPVGAALGKGVGPLVVTRPQIAGQRPDEWRKGGESGESDSSKEKIRLGLPGNGTTAHLLARLWIDSFDLIDSTEIKTNRAGTLWDDIELVFLPFHEVISEVQRGTLDAGVVIHESRFTYEDHDLALHTDLGAWWSETEGMPLPLGALVASRKRFDSTQRKLLGEMLRNSLNYAHANPSDPLDYMLSLSRETDESALRGHIELYVNEYTNDLGDAGRKAILRLFERGAAVGMIPDGYQTAFD